MVPVTARANPDSRSATGHAYSRPNSDQRAGVPATGSAQRRQQLPAGLLACAAGVRADQALAVRASVPLPLGGTPCTRSAQTSSRARVRWGSTPIRRDSIRFVASHTSAQWKFRPIQSTRSTANCSDRHASAHAVHAPAQRTHSFTNLVSAVPSTTSGGMDPAPAPVANVATSRRSLHQITPGGYHRNGRATLPAHLFSPRRAARCLRWRCGDRRAPGGAPSPADRSGTRARFHAHLRPRRPPPEPPRRKAPPAGRRRGSRRPHRGDAHCRPPHLRRLRRPRPVAGVQYLPRRAVGTGRARTGGHMAAQTGPASPRPTAAPPRRTRPVSRPTAGTAARTSGATVGVTDIGPDRRPPAGRRFAMSERPR